MINFKQFSQDKSLQLQYGCKLFSHPSEKKIQSTSGWNERILPLFGESSYFHKIWDI